MLHSVGLIRSYGLSSGLKPNPFNITSGLAVFRHLAQHVLPEITEEMEDIKILCNFIHHVSRNDSCFFVKTTKDCQPDDGFINYTQFLYCVIPKWLLPLGLVLCFMWLFILFITLGTTADDFFCPALSVISKMLKLTQNIAGVTFLAFGNGSPDIFSAIAVLSDSNSSDSSLAIGALFGAGIFVTTIVAGSVCISSPFQLMERPFLRDIIFYLSAVFWTFTILYRAEITTAQSVGFIGLYIGYVTVVLLGGYIHQKYEKTTKIQKVYTIDVDPNAAYLNEKEEYYEEAASSNLNVESRRRNSSLKLKPSRTITDFANIAESVTVASVLGGDVESNPALLQKKFMEYEGSLDMIAATKSFDTNDSSESICSNDVSRPSPFIDFLLAISPVDPQEWAELRWYMRLFEIIKAPILFLLKITTPVVDDTVENNNWCKWLNALHCVTGPMMAVMAINHSATISGTVPVWSIVLAVGVVLCIIVLFTSQHDIPPFYHKAFAYMGFVVAVIWIYTVANEIVNLLQTFGIVFDISNAVLGLTFLAWGNSLGDFLTDIMMARQGFPRMAISACFGGPLFNLLLGLGIPLTITTIRNNGVVKITYSHLQMVLAGFLALSLLSSLIILPLRRFHASRGYGFYLISLYITFLTTALLTEFEIIFA